MIQIWQVSSECGPSNLVVRCTYLWSSQKLHYHFTWHSQKSSTHCEQNFCQKGSEETTISRFQTTNWTLKNWSNDRPRLMHTLYITYAQSWWKMSTSQNRVFSLWSYRTPEESMFEESTVNLLNGKPTNGYLWFQTRWMANSIIHISIQFNPVQSRSILFNPG